MEEASRAKIAKKGFMNPARKKKLRVNFEYRLGKSFLLPFFVVVAS